MNKNLQKILSKPVLTSIFFNKYNSFIKESIIESYKPLKKDKAAKSSIYLKSQDQINSQDNSLIIINSDNNINSENNNNSLFNKENKNINESKRGKINYFNYNNLYTNKKYKLENFKKFFESKKDILKDNNDFPFNKYLNLKNISNNINDSISQLDKTYFNFINNDEITENNQLDFTSVKKKFYENKNYIENQSNIFKIEYLKRLIRKYYYDNFENLKDFYNFINVKNNSNLTIDDFVHFLKNTLKILLDKKEIRYLLNANGIININYHDFKHIFFPEQINNKVVNLKLKNEKSFPINSQIKLNNCVTIRRNGKSDIIDIKNENRKTLPLIDKRIKPLKHNHKINMKLIKKIKLYDEIMKNINKDSIENESSNKKKNSLKINKTSFILHIYKTLIKNKKDINLEFHNKKKFAKSLIKLNEINVKKNIKNEKQNQKDTKENNKSNNNIKIICKEKNDINPKTNNINKQINDNKQLNECTHINNNKQIKGNKQINDNSQVKKNEQINDKKQINENKQTNDKQQLNNNMQINDKKQINDNKQINDKQQLNNNMQINDKKQINDNKQTNNKIINIINDNRSPKINNLVKNENKNNNYYKSNIKVNNKSDNIKKSEINKESILKNINEKIKENSIFSNNQKINRTLNINKINSLKDSLNSLKNKNNVKLFFNSEINKKLKEESNKSIQEEKKNKEKNLDILEYL